VSGDCAARLNLVKPASVVATALQWARVERGKRRFPWEAAMRARYPDIEGFIERGGVKVGYEVFGEGEPAVVFPPVDGIVQSRCWKAQVPYLARTSKVVTIDPRGNGRSDRPQTAAAYADTEFVADTIAVMDAAGVDRAVLVGHCTSSWYAFLAAGRHPDRVLGVVAIAPWTPFLTPPLPARMAYDFDEVLDTEEGWAKSNRHYWLRDWRGYAEFFMGEMLAEPHSTKQREDCVGWAMEIGPETMLLQHEGSMLSSSREETEALLRQVTCPVLVIHGGEDRCQALARGERVAEVTGGELLALEGAGHVPQAREPVVVSHAIRDFADRFRPAPAARKTWTRPLNRPKRVLYVSSPIGLGHARRDLAIADELRTLRPGLEVHWLAQHPVTELLQRRSELIHPASAFLANESGHIESESAEHDLHAFQAVRNMDEILISNFMVFADLVRDEQFDLWAGDEAWDIDYFLHENPELKRAPYAWMTDFVGWLPMPDGGAAERALTTDYNAEMIEQVARFPSLRDRAVFVGNPGDVVPDGFGTGLPPIRDWVAQNYQFSGYVSGISPGEFDDRAALRAELGYRDGEQVCVVTVGGSGVGTNLIRRVVAAFPAAKRLVPGLRMIVVAGPRIDPASISSHDGLEVHGYVHDLYRHLAACDLAVVQGGLTTTMELAASQRPFIYVPLRHHFEQNFHVRHRLAQYGAGRCVDYEDTVPEALAAAIAEEMARPVSYRPVETDGAKRAAAVLAELI
jgi:pimeloyl-ACP methyl ester carboxylesterase/predicted glycosyltransferase